MSLKFGIYLVEQRIITPEQFCGLVKIQQEATTSLATIAIRKNMLTIKQVAEILDLQDGAPNKSFGQIAMEIDVLDRADVQELAHVQQTSCPSIRRLVVECGLMRHPQAAALYQQFERFGTRSMYTATESTDPPIGQTPAPHKPLPMPFKPPQPKFKQRPVFVQPNSSTLYES